jgi:Slime mold cyclic AMP receptor
MEGYIAVSTCSCISIIGNSIIFYYFLKIKELQKVYEYQFIFVFAVLDLIQLLAVLIPTFEYSLTSLCEVQGIMLQVGRLSGILWAGFIAIAMLFEVVLSRERFSKGFIIPILIIISISIVTSTIPLISGNYSFMDFWCWIKSDNAYDDYLFRFLLFYGILWVIIILNLAVYFSVLWKSKNEEIYDFVGMRLVKRLKWYPWILFFCYLPLTTVRIMDGTTEVPYTFNLLASCLYILIGFFNSIAFVSSDKIKPEFFKLEPKKEQRLTMIPKSKK